MSRHAGLGDRTMGIRSAFVLLLFVSLALPFGAEAQSNLELQERALAGDKDASYRLFRRFFMGPERDDRLADIWIRVAVAQGHSDAMKLLASGLVAQNSAASRYEGAALLMRVVELNDHNSAAAANTLADLFAKWSPEATSSNEWHEKAASLGHVLSMVDLASSKDIPRVRAMAWAMTGCRYIIMGSDLQTKACKLKDEIASDLGKDDLKAALELSNGFLEGLGIKAKSSDSG